MNNVQENCSQGLFQIAKYHRFDAMCPTLNLCPLVNPTIHQISDVLLFGINHMAHSMESETFVDFQGKKTASLLDHISRFLKLCSHIQLLPVISLPGISPMQLKFFR